MAAMPETPPDVGARADPDELELTVVIPCLDEAQTIGLCVGKAVASMKQAGIRGEVVVSDNGSKDDSIAVATQAGARVVRCPVRGYGAALQFGFRAARGRYLIMGDADDSYDFTLVPAFVAKLREGHPYVIGSRLRGKIEEGAMPTLNRWLGTPVLTFILNRLYGTHISDCNCGMRGFERRTYRRIGAVAPGMEFASELIVKAAVRGVPIEEIPIDFYKDKRGRPPHLRPWRDGWRHLRLLLWHAPDRALTLPGLLLTLAGVIGTFASFGHDRAVLFALLALVGMPPLAGGLAIQAVAEPGRVRRSARAWLTFDRAAVAAGLFLAAGLACAAVVGLEYLRPREGFAILVPRVPNWNLILTGALAFGAGVGSLVLALLMGAAGATLRAEVPPFPVEADDEGRAP
ncbi:MAG TPA: glycosyltransferase family 2 protein [Myxococcales bacterium]|nr:glycosyltransferase family 2 protein [Myxococcales bacterium]